jgi:hypothetical protein
VSGDASSSRAATAYTTPPEPTPCELCGDPNGRFMGVHPPQEVKYRPMRTCDPCTPSPNPFALEDDCDAFE